MSKKFLFLIFATVAGFIGYFLNRFIDCVMTQTGLPMEKIIAGVQSFNITVANDPMKLVLTPEALLGFVFPFVALAFIWAVREPQKNYRFHEEYGSAYWAKVEEFLPFRNPKFSDNVIIAYDVYMDMRNVLSDPDYYRNNNVVVIGGPGSQKTRSYIEPNLLQMHGSYVLTDPKGSTLRKTGKIMEEEGYKVKVFDLSSLTNSDKFNPFVYIHDEITLKRMISVLIDATNDENARKGDDFWGKSEELLLSSLFGFLYYQYRGDGKVEGDGRLPSIAEISDLIRLLRRENPEVPSVLEEMFMAFEERFGPRNYAVLMFNSFKNYAGETRSSVEAIATSRFTMFDLDVIRDLMDEDTLELDKLGTQKMVIYLTIPDLDKTFNFLTVMVFLLAFRNLEHQADTIFDGELPIPVRFMMDEFANLGRIPNIKEALSVFRSRNMSLDLIVQTLNQLQVLYEKDWKSLVGTCDTKIYLSGATEPDTTKFFSEIGGKQTIDTRYYNESRGRNGSSTKNVGRLGRDLITQDEILRLPRVNSLVSISSMPLLKAKKYDPNNHPLYKYVAKGPKDPWWYNYKKYKNNVEQWKNEVAKEEPYVQITLEVDETAA